MGSLLQDYADLLKAFKPDQFSYTKKTFDKDGSSLNDIVQITESNKKLTLCFRWETSSEDVLSLTIQRQPLKFLLNADSSLNYKSYSVTFDLDDYEILSLIGVKFYRRNAEEIVVTFPSECYTAKKMSFSQ